MWATRLPQHLHIMWEAQHLVPRYLEYVSEIKRRGKINGFVEKSGTTEGQKGNN
jgi:hypothetical protein